MTGGLGKCTYFWAGTICTFCFEEIAKACRGAALPKRNLTSLYVNKCLVEETSVRIV